MNELKIIPTADIELTVRSAADGNIFVEYKTAVADKKLLSIALMQLNAETTVKRGENKGRQLKHINVVRDIQNISVSKKAEGPLPFKIPGD